MNKTAKFLSKCSIFAIALVTLCADAATTSARPSVSSTTARPKVTTGASTSRMPTVTAQKTATTNTTAPAATETEPEPERVIVVDNKTSQFNDVLTDIGGIAPDTSSDDLAERVRQQRALLDSAGNQTTATTSSGTTGANACDMGLRKCMSEKCGNDFTKCANDSTTIWGDKMDACRRATKCTGHEYTLLAPEILADRDMNVRMAYYNSVLNCGNRYNSCIFTECGTYLDKCLAKSDGDRAISKCESVARECREQDSGLAARVMGAFGTLRTVATANVQKDEARLYELRDLMRASCKRLGATLDERTLDCVYTVNFFAGDDTETPKASKKLYAGDTFQCNTNWFGIDVTTFKENAYRLTRSQKSASAAALGAGVGSAAGLLSSDAIGRARDTQKAKTARDEAVAAEQAAKAQENQGENGDQRNYTPNVEKPRGDETTNTLFDKTKQVLEKSNVPVADIYACTIINTESTCVQNDKCSWKDGKCIATASA